MPSTTRQYPPAGLATLPSPREHRQRLWRLSRHPLIAICTAQAALSLILVWSNTAFGDEADYLRIGHLEIAHWLHGASWPAAYADRILSGSPAIYPPLGALADTIGGLTGARILSLLLMLSATVLLYLTASRLIGRGGAAVAAAIWALSEPALRLAFATYDPLSVVLTALSAWLIVLGYRHGSASVVAAAAALALANATAYSGIVIDPVIIAFAFLVWLHRMHARRAALRTVFFAGCSAVFFALLMTASRSWAGIMFTVIYRSGTDHQRIQLVLNDIWKYSGLVIILAVIGVFTAVGTESRQRAALLALLGCAAFIVPAAQLREQTGWSLDKHLAYGVWFAAIAAGYACKKLVQWLPGGGGQLAAVSCVIALAYLGGNSWASAWQVYHSWADARPFITAFKPVVAQSRGSIYAGGAGHIGEYYTSEGLDWTRWNTTLSLNPATGPPGTWKSYYAAQLRNGDYGVIVLFYTTTFSSKGIPGKFLVSRPGNGTYRTLLGMVGNNSGQPGLPALTLALKDDSEYRLVAVGPYDSAHDYRIYTIWQKVQD